MKTIPSLILALALLVFFGCKKQDPAPPTGTATTPTPTATLHTFELRWITAATEVSRGYCFPSGGLLMTKYDTVYTGISSVTYKYEQGIPNKYAHTMKGYCYNSSADSIEVQIWIDGVLKAKDKDEGYIDLIYHY